MPLTKKQLGQITIDSPNNHENYNAYVNALTIKAHAAGKSLMEMKKNLADSLNEFPVSLANKLANESKNPEVADRLKERALFCMESHATLEVRKIELAAAMLEYRENAQESTALKMQTCLENYESAAKKYDGAMTKLPEDIQKALTDCADIFPADFMNSNGCDDNTQAYAKTVAAVAVNNVDFVKWIDEAYSRMDQLSASINDAEKNFQVYSANMRASMAISQTGSHIGPDDVAYQDLVLNFLMETAGKAQLQLELDEKNEDAAMHIFASTMDNSDQPMAEFSVDTADQSTDQGIGFEQVTEPVRAEMDETAVDGDVVLVAQLP